MRKPAISYQTARRLILKAMKVHGVDIRWTRAEDRYKAFKALMKEWPNISPEMRRKILGRKPHARS